MYRIIAFLIGSFCSVIAKADSLDIKIGQMLMVGMSGTTVNDNAPIIQDIKKGIVGGILYFENNISPVNSKATLAKLSRKLNDAANIPLLISIDQEGGQVNRLKPKYGFKPTPSAKSVAAKHSDTYTRKVADDVTEALISCGINLNYAPVLDIDNPLCPVLGKRQRCYSNIPDSITHHAAIVIEAHHDKGVKTVVKHFPGHGNSRTDSHLGVVDVTKYWNEKELKPYINLIGDGVVDAVMTAHIVNRKLDPSGLPATLSKKIVTDLLRNTLKFNGVIISDDMQMHAISSHYGFEESIEKCILAGVDILMFSNNIKGAENYKPTNLHATIKGLVKEGKISEARINESYQRIMVMKRRR